MKKIALLAAFVVIALPACKHLSCKKEDKAEPVAIEVIEVQPIEDHKAE